jgi:hypothetical protein
MITIEPTTRMLGITRYATYSTPQPEWRKVDHYLRTYFTCSADHAEGKYYGIGGRLMCENLLTIEDRRVTETVGFDICLTMGANFMTLVRPTTRFHVDTTVQAHEDKIYDVGCRLLWEQT